MSITVLIVDDDENARQNISEMLVAKNMKWWAWDTGRGPQST